jgi:hypothetical protein
MSGRFSDTRKLMEKDARRGLGKASRMEIRLAPAAKQRPASAPSKVSGKRTTLGDLLDRAVAKLAKKGSR